MGVKIITGKVIECTHARKLIRGKTSIFKGIFYSGDMVILMYLNVWAIPKVPW